jgi:hypothetical protein
LRIQIRWSSRVMHSRNPHRNLYPFLHQVEQRGKHLNGPTATHRTRTDGFHHHLLQPRPMTLLYRPMSHYHRLHLCRVRHPIPRFIGRKATTRRNMTNMTQPCRPSHPRCRHPNNGIVHLLSLLWRHLLRR